MNSVRLRQIELALSAKEQLGASAEQLARNLHALLSHATQMGGSKSSIAVAAGLASDVTDVTQALKKLDEVTIPTLISAEKLARRVQRLRKKPARYVDVARQCAKILSLSEDQVMERLFDGTDYGTGRRVAEDDYDPTRELVLAIRHQCDQICRSLNLEEYWRKLLDTSGRYDPRIDRIMPAQQSLVINGEGLKGSATCVDEMVPIPSISLVRRPQSAPAKGTLLIASAPEAEDFDPNDADNMPYLSPIGWLGEHMMHPGTAERPIIPAHEYVWDTSEFDAIEASFSYWLDIRLALGPQLDFRESIGPSTLGPLIELRSELEAVIGDDKVVFDNPFGGVVRWAKVKGRWHKAVISVALSPELPRYGDGCYFDMPHEWYFSWGEFSAQSLEHVLSSEFIPDAPVSHIRPDGDEFLSINPLMQIIEERFLKGIVGDLTERAWELCTLLSEFRKTRIRNFRRTSAIKQSELETHSRRFSPPQY